MDVCSADVVADTQAKLNEASASLSAAFSSANDWMATKVSAASDMFANDTEVSAFCPTPLAVCVEQMSLNIRRIFCRL
jgi:hypothetical protein